jgi:hypothetical protein
MARASTAIIPEAFSQQQLFVSLSHLADQAQETTTSSHTSSDIVIRSGMKVSTAGTIPDMARRGVLASGRAHRADRRRRGYRSRAQAPYN